MRSDRVVAAAWGFAEATLFFVVPDVAVGWVALQRPRQAVVAWFAAVLGAVLGATVLHRAVSAGREPERLFRSLPGTQPGDLERVRRDVEADPRRAFVTGSFSGRPMKFYVAEAARQGLTLRVTLVLTIANRAPRIAVFAVMVAVIGAVARRIRPPSRGLFVGAYAAGWALFYSWYWFIRTPRPPA